LVVIGEASGPIGSDSPGEAGQQCSVRLANEVVEHLNTEPPDAVVRSRLRCECGDAGCKACVDITHSEYEAVRAYGSHFVIKPDHENSENSAVLHENARFAVIDVVAANDRYEVLACNPRHAWSDVQVRKPE
jgi:hypothetical protein